MTTMIVCDELDDVIWSDLCNGNSGVFIEALLIARRNGMCSVTEMRNHAARRSDEHRVIFEQLSRVMSKVEFPDGVELLVMHHLLLQQRYHEAFVAFDCVIDGSCCI